MDKQQKRYSPEVRERALGSAGRFDPFFGSG
jgi:hypothetical protein